MLSLLFKMWKPAFPDIFMYLIALPISTPVCSDIRLPTNTQTIKTGHISTSDRLTFDEKPTNKTQETSHSPAH
jgi:hypothetical protein